MSGLLVGGLVCAGLVAVVCFSARPRNVVGPRQAEGAGQAAAVPGPGRGGSFPGKFVASPGQLLRRPAASSSDLGPSGGWPAVQLTSAGDARGERVPVATRASAGDGKPGAGSPETGIDRLLSLPVPMLIQELRSSQAHLVLQPSDSARILDKVCAYVGAELDPAASSSAKEMELQNDLKNAYSSLRERGALRGYGSCADALLPLRKEYFMPQDQEDVTGLPMQAFRPSGGIGLPEFVLGSATVFGITGLEQVLGLGYGRITAPLFAALSWDAFLLRGALVEAIARTVRPKYRNAVLKHEAGHLLVAYLMGNPVQDCLLDPLAAFKDGRFSGVRGIQAGTVFYDPELGDAMRLGTLSRSCLDRYAVIVMAGIAAEALENGRAEGGIADERALVRLLTSLDGGKTWDPERIKAQARWGVSQAFALLRDHRPAYDTLCETLRGGGSIGEAIMAIEGALSQLAELPAEARKRSALTGAQ